MTHGKPTDQESHTADSGPSSAQRPQLVILAAGLGQRFGGEKSLSGVGPHGESLLEFAIHDACCAGFGSFLLVIREDIATDTKAKILSRLPDDLQIGFAYQSADQCPANVPRRKKPWGTGHALLQTNSKIQDSFCVINADDYYGASSFGHMMARPTYLAPTSNSSRNL